MKNKEKQYNYYYFINLKLNAYTNLSLITFKFLIKEKTNHSLFLLGITF